MRCGECNIIAVGTIVNKKKFFNKIDFNKLWDESDWEKYFQAQDAYRMSLRSEQIRKKPISRFQFEGSDEVAAFEPVVREYGYLEPPSVVEQIRGVPFNGDSDPESDYHPATDEDPHYWGEGAPLAASLIYRDCCRFAICTRPRSDQVLETQRPRLQEKI